MRTLRLCQINLRALDFKFMKNEICIPLSKKKEIFEGPEVILKASEDSEAPQV